MQLLLAFYEVNGIGALIQYILPFIEDYNLEAISK
jgi:hypothetical protein